VKHLNIYIWGEVQGVFFRDSAMKKANELGLVGFVRNETDDSIYMEVEGEEEVLNEFLVWCGSGPPLAKVDKINQEESKLVGYDTFEVH
jgi:acylphosphatase